MNQSISGRSRAIIVSLAAGATVIFNILATALPLNNIQTADISNKYFTVFTPAGYVFSIWGLIYIGLTAYAAYHWRKSSLSAEWLQPGFKWFLLSCVANCLWLVLWHTESIALSVLVMLVLLFSLIKLYINLEIGIYPASALTKYMVHVPISIYLGWISVATVANIAAAFTQLGWDRAGIFPQVWSVTMICVAAILGILMLINRSDVFYAGVIIWAAIGIAAEPRAGGSFPVISGAVFAVVISLVTLMIFLPRGAKQSTTPKDSQMVVSETIAIVSKFT